MHMLFFLLYYCTFSITALFIFVILFACYYYCTSAMNKDQGRIYPQRGPVRKKCGALHLENWGAFLLITLVVHSGCPLFRACKKFAAPFVGPPVRPEYAEHA